MVKAFILVMLLSLLCGCGSHKEAQVGETLPEDPAADRQRLVFSVVEMDTPGYTIEELEEAPEGKLVYSGLSEVNVHMDGKEIPFAQALREGDLTLPEVFAFARIDAKNGYCTETYRSENGLTHFTYTYPQCELNLKYDVYETPDGAQHLIEDIMIHDIPGESTITSRSKSMYVDEESQWGYFIDREDWGLTFELVNAASDQITLKCSQSGGQQLGTLVIEGYYLYATDTADPEALPTYIGKAFGDVRAVQLGDPAQGLPIPVPMEGVGQVIIDWSTEIGIRAPGSYYIHLIVSDSYEESEVHPLMKNFYDKQSYHIPFVIP